MTAGTSAWRGASLAGRPPARYDPSGQALGPAAATSEPSAGASLAMLVSWQVADPIAGFQFHSFWQYGSRRIAPKRQAGCGIGATVMLSLWVGRAGGGSDTGSSRGASGDVAGRARHPGLSEHVLRQVQPVALEAMCHVSCHSTFVSYADHRSSAQWVLYGQTGAHRGSQRSHCGHRERSAHEGAG